MSRNWRRKISNIDLGITRDLSRDLRCAAEDCLVAAATLKCLKRGAPRKLHPVSVFVFAFVYCSRQNSVLRLAPTAVAVNTLKSGSLRLRHVQHCTSSEALETWGQQTGRSLFSESAGPASELLNLYPWRADEIPRKPIPEAVRKKGMSRKRSEKNEYRVTGSVLDELGLDRQAALELKLKAALHQNILQLVKRRGYRARDLERILQIQQPRVSELTRGKLSTLSVARLLLYADLLGAEAEVKLKKARAHAAA